MAIEAPDLLTRPHRRAIVMSKISELQAGLFALELEQLAKGATDSDPCSQGPTFGEARTDIQEGIRRIVAAHGTLLLDRDDDGA